ncbi:hypothetical protein DUI87_23087 [Hirundo rustica rustica]|uniref:Uncharacterized protein n=1 Tax=Hirundo rustica rustica TaxID=333673 RepID=A0A3M0K015_HIRRU|nr:hypothetical protein DUI87_23087 [Hirundo rustica rustica]
MRNEGWQRVLAPLLSSPVTAPYGILCTALAGTPNLGRAQMFECIQTRATRLVKGLEHKSYEEAEGAGVVQPGQEEGQGDLITLHNSLKGGCSQVGIGLFSQVTSARTRGPSLKLHQGKFRLEIRKKFFTERVIRHLNGLPRAVVESPSLEVALSDTV